MNRFPNAFLDHLFEFSEHGNQGRLAVAGQSLFQRSITSIDRIETRSNLTWKGRLISRDGIMRDRGSWLCGLGFIDSKHIKVRIRFRYHLAKGQLPLGENRGMRLLQRLDDRIFKYVKHGRRFGSGG